MKNVLVALLLGLGAYALHPSLLDAEEPWDPLEPVNRGIFWFNDKFDTYIGEPVARGYDWAMPQTVQTGVGNFFSNIKYPIYLVSDLVQFKFKQAFNHTGRFVINTTLGVGGVIDVAKHMKLPEHHEDIGVSLAYHGVPAGPYLVLPFLGPSNLRDGVGRLAQIPLNPVYYFSFTDASSDLKWAVSGGLTAIEFIDTRANLLEAVEAAKESSVDYYLFMQSAYYQYRRGLVYDGNPPEEEFGEEFDFDTPDKELQTASVEATP